MAGCIAVEQVSRGCVGHGKALGGFCKRKRTMSFAADGFLSPTMDRFRASLKNVAAYKAWFDYAEELRKNTRTCVACA
jgi:hypothetical protein